jgi:streptogramin lyase
MWATDAANDALVEISVKGGRPRVFPLFASVGGRKMRFTPQDLAVGADRRFYVEGYAEPGTLCDVILVVSFTGRTRTSTTPSSDCPTGGLALGPDGSVWFTERQHIAEISQRGQIREYTYPITAGHGGALTSGPDDLWFILYTGFGAPSIAETEPQSGRTVLYPTPNGCRTGALGMKATPGTLYMLCVDFRAQSFVLWTAHGLVESYPTTVQPTSNLVQPSRGRFWWAGYESVPNVPELASFDLATRAVTTVPSPFGGPFPATAADRNGAIWAVSGRYFVRYVP